MKWSDPPGLHPGDRIRVTGILPDDPAPLDIGAEGTVTSVDAFDLGNGRRFQISVDWDDGRTLMLLNTDPFEKVS